MTLKAMIRQFQLLYNSFVHIGRLIQLAKLAHKPLHLNPNPCILFTNDYTLLTLMPVNPPQPFTSVQVK